MKKNPRTTEKKNIDEGVINSFVAFCRMQEKRGNAQSYPGEYVMKKSKKKRVKISNKI